MEKYTAGETFGKQFGLYYNGKFEIDTWYNRTPKQEYMAFNSSLEPKAGELVLNAGFGNHTLLQEIGEQRKDLTVVAIDVHINISKVKEILKKYKNITVQHTDILDLPLTFKDETFDKVLCSGAVHHTPDPRRAFDNLCRVTKKGGKLSTLIYGPEFCVYLSLKKYFPTAYKLSPKRLYRLSAFLAYMIAPVIFSGRMVRSKFRSLPKINTKQLKFSIYDSLGCKYLYRYDEKEIKKWYEDNGFTFKKLGRWNYIGAKNR